MPYSKVLKINGYTPPPTDEDGVVIGKQKIWSENTKRNAKCSMVGDIKAIKTTILVTWSKMTQSQLNGLDKAINDSNTPFFYITYADESGNEKTKKFYSDSSIEYTRHKYRRNRDGEYTDIYYKDVSIYFAEQ